MLMQIYWFSKRINHFRNSITADSRRYLHRASKVSSHTIEAIFIDHWGCFTLTSLWNIWLPRKGTLFSTNIYHKPTLFATIFRINHTLFSTISQSYSFINYINYNYYRRMGACVCFMHPDLVKSCNHWEIYSGTEAIKKRRGKPLRTSLLQYTNEMLN